MRDELQDAEQNLLWKGGKTHTFIFRGHNRLELLQYCIYSLLYIENLMFKESTKLVICYNHVFLKLH